MPSTIIFDVDGTLVDSVDLLARYENSLPAGASGKK